LIGIKDGSSYYKYMELQSDVVTTADYEKAYKNWLKEKEKSNKKAQDELEKHVK
jgi:oligopeptide ABC superfamily ATP binding cassette transporter, permease protein